MAGENVAPQMKRCKGCGEEKPQTAEFFYFKKIGWLASAFCRGCAAKASHAHYHANREKCLAQMARQREENRDEILARKRAYAARNREKINTYAAERYRNHRERILAEQKARYRANPAPFREVMRRVEANRRANDPRFRLDQNMKSAVRMALRGRKNGRSWEALVCYSANDLCRHLERQFAKGMTWANYGQWHVDHIVPKSAFTYMLPGDPDFAACWALTNLRPLWAVANLKKRDSRELLI